MTIFVVFFLNKLSLFDFCIFDYITHKGVASTHSYTHQRETTEKSNVSCQLRPFLQWALLFKERICSQREQILSLKRSPI